MDLVSISKIRSTNTSIEEIKGTIDVIRGDISDINSEISDLAKTSETVYGSTSYTINDSVDYPLLGMKVYGKSTQDGTPTPENPVEITSVVEPTVTVCGRNLLKLPDFTKTTNGVTCTIKNGVLTLKGTATQETFINFSNVAYVLENETYIYYSNDYDFNKASLNLVNNISNWSEEPSFFNAINRPKTIGKNGVLCLSIRIPKNVVADITFTPRLEIGTTATAYEPYKGTVLTLPDTLHGIPVNSGGNVTINGQEYISDYVDFERGVKVQMVLGVRMYGTADGWVWKLREIGTEYYSSHPYTSFFKNILNTPAISNAFLSGANWGDNSKNKIGVSNGDAPYVFVGASTFSSLSELTSYLDNNVVYVYSPLETPIETPLSETEMQAYRQLATYNGMTNIFNDKGAGISATYCTNKAMSNCVAPLKSDLQKQIDELKAAVLSLGGNV